MIWFHDLKHSQCKFITGTGLFRLTSGGVDHLLSKACGAPTGGATYCPHHTELVRPAWQPDPPSPPRDIHRAPAAPREERIPDLTEVIR